MDSQMDRKLNNEEPQARFTRRRLLSGAATLLLSAAVLPATVARAAKKAAWNSSFELAIDFEINDPDAKRYHRPFVAVWIEDSDTMAVRTLSLWVQKTGRGPRWIPDLRRWYRDEQERKAIDGGNLATTISSATRQPGKYSVVWNGRDDQGKVVPQGDYIVCIEAAREKGTYQIIRSEVTLESKPFRKQLDGNIEIKGATVEYRKR